MLSLNQIERHFATGRFDALVDAVAGNGLALPLPVRARLLDHVTAAAVGLGLRRLVELTYGPTALSRAMTAVLLGVQQEDGSFGDPVVTAVALSALGKLVAEHRVSDPAVVQACERAMAALAAAQADDGLFRSTDDRTQQDRALSGAYVLYLLAGDEAFRQHVRFADLMGWFEQRHEDLEPDTDQLFQLARLHTHGPRPLSPAARAIAA